MAKWKETVQKETQLEMFENVPSESDERTANNAVRHKYRVLSDEEKDRVLDGLLLAQKRAAFRLLPALRGLALVELFAALHEGRTPALLMLRPTQTLEQKISPF